MTDPNKKRILFLKTSVLLKGTLSVEWSEEYQYQESLKSDGRILRGLKYFSSSIFVSFLSVFFIKKLPYFALKEHFFLLVVVAALPFLKETFIHMYMG